MTDQNKPYTTWGRLYNDIRKNAAARGIPFALARSEFDALVKRSEGRCMVSGIPFDATPFVGSARRPFAPSVDRIDSAQGYMVGNVRLVCVLVNLALNQWGLDPLLRVARNLVEREKEIQVNTETWLSSPNKRRRLWSPASYVGVRDYLIERYGAETVMHVREVSRLAQRYCKLNGIETVHVEQLTYYRNDGTRGRDIVSAYPRSVLDMVCNEVIADGEELVKV